MPMVVKFHVMTRKYIMFSSIFISANALVVAAYIFMSLPDNVSDNRYYAGLIGLLIFVGLFLTILIGFLTTSLYENKKNN